MNVIQKEGASKLGDDHHRERSKLSPWEGVSSLWSFVKYITEAATTQGNEGWPEAEANVLVWGSLKDVVLSICIWLWASVDFLWVLLEEMVWVLENHLPSLSSWRKQHRKALIPHNSFLDNNCVCPFMSWSKSSRRNSCWKKINWYDDWFIASSWYKL